MKKYKIRIEKEIYYFWYTCINHNHNCFTKNHTISKVEYPSQRFRKNLYFWCHDVKRVFLEHFCQKNWLFARKEHVFSSFRNVFETQTLSCSCYEFARFFFQLRVLMESVCSCLMFSIAMNQITYAYVYTVWVIGNCFENFAFYLYAIRLHLRWI